MPDILQILSDYFSQKIEESKESEFRLKIPADLIEHALKFYLSPYLSEMKVIFAERSLEIMGTNILPVSLKLKIDAIHWDRERKLVSFELNVSDPVFKFIRSPLQSLRERTKEIITVEEKKISIDFEKLFTFMPKWNSITYSLRNKIRLTDILFDDDNHLILVFERVKP